MPSLFFCGFGSGVGFLDGVSGSFTLPYQNCGDAPAPPHPPAWGGCPRTPQSLPRLILLPFAPARLAPPTFPGPAPPPVVLPAAGAGHFFFSRIPPRSFSLAPLAPSNKVEMARKAARLLPCPDEILPGGPRWDLGYWYWGRVFARPWAGCRVRPCAGGAAGRFASPKPGPPARASCLAGRGPCPPAAKRRPPGAAPALPL